MAALATFLLLASTVTSIALQPVSAEAAASDRSPAGQPACETVLPADEHRGLTGNAAAVERLYRALFLRSPTEAGLSYWTQRIQSGATDLPSVAGRFAESDEFHNRYGRVSDTEFVELLYCNVLGRQQQQTGSRYWQDRLSGPAGRSDVTLYFSQSDEFITRSALIEATPTAATTSATAITTETAAASKTTATSKTAATTSTKARAATARPELGALPEKLAMVDEAPPSADTDRESSDNTDFEPVQEPATDNPVAEDPKTKDPVIEEPVLEQPKTEHPKADVPVTSPQLVWQDEFTTLDTAIWRPEHSTYGDGNNELQCYRPQNVSVKDGSLVLTAKKEKYTCPNGSVREATSGMVRGAVDFEYGQRIEFRVKVNPADENDQRGLWPALWASSWNGGGWPTGGEFDWLEYVGTTPTRANHAIHYADTTGKHRHVSKAIELDEKFSDNWHTIGFDWTDELVWYLDGEEVQRLDPDAIGAKGSPFGPNARSVTQIKLNFALGGNWPGPLGPTTLDAEGNTNFAIDYVRIYDL